MQFNSTGSISNMKTSSSFAYRRYKVVTLTIGFAILSVAAQAQQLETESKTKLDKGEQPIPDVALTFKGLRSSSKIPIQSLSFTGLADKRTGQSELLSIFVDDRKNMPELSFKGTNNGFDDFADLEVTLLFTGIPERGQTSLTDLDGTWVAKRATGDDFHHCMVDVESSFVCALEPSEHSIESFGKVAGEVSFIGDIVSGQLIGAYYAYWSKDVQKSCPDLAGAQPYDLRNTRVTSNGSELKGEVKYPKLDLERCDVDHDDWVWVPFTFQRVMP